MMIAKKQTKKLSTKLLQYYLILPMCIVAVMFGLFYAYASHALISREESALETLDESFLSAVDQNLRSLDQLSASINYVNRRSGILTQDLSDSDPSNSAIREFLISQNGPRPKANQINIYSFDHTVYKVGISTKTESWSGRDLPLLDSILKNSGHKIIGTPYLTRAYSLGSSSEDWYLSLYRTAYNSTNQPIGIIETVARCKNLFYNIRNYIARTQRNEMDASVYIFDENGTLVFPYDSAAPGYPAEQAAFYWDTVQTINSGDYQREVIANPITDISYRYVLRQSTYSKWSFLILQEENEILRPVRGLLKVLLPMVSLLLIVSILIARILTHNLIAPLNHLKHVIQRLRIDTVGQETVEGQTPQYEELRALYREFQEMNTSLRISLNELAQARDLEIQSRAMALQAQMNPHFYYNSLSCVSILAEDGQTDEVSRMCQSLSQIMRYITDTHRSTVTIREEIEHIRQYLYCMKIRYEDSLQCCIHIDDSLLDLNIPKLSIQPFVENALKYGTNCAPPWTIKIEGYRDDSLWYIQVSDSGTGFPSQVEDRLKSRINSFQTQPGADISQLQLGIGGMGILNVFVRWKLQFKENTFFDFGNTEDGHAYVRIGIVHRQSEDTNEI